MTDQQTIEVLNRALSYVDKGWCQFSNARDAKGKGVTRDDASATCWCLSGACERAAMELDYDPADMYQIGHSLFATLTSVQSRVSHPTIWNTIVDYNDDKDRTADDISRLLKRTIQRLTETPKEEENDARSF